MHGSVVFESAALNALAAFAEAGHGAAIVPATFRNKGERVRIARLELRRKPVNMQLAILWDGNKPLPRFAEKFPELFLAHATALMRGGNYGLGGARVRRILARALAGVSFYGSPWCDAAHRSSRAIRLDVSQRRPPIFCTSA